MEHRFAKVFLVAMCVFGCTEQAWAILDLSPDYLDPPYSDSAEREEIFPQSALADRSFSAQLERLNKAIVKFPESGTLLEKRAMLCADNGQYKAALKDINSAIDLCRERFSYYWTRAQIQLHEKDYSAALRDCTFARKIAPRQICWTSDWLRAQIYKAMGQQRESVCAAEDALNSMANNGTTDDQHMSELKALLAGDVFKPARKTRDKKSVLVALHDLANFSQPPTEDQLCKLLEVPATALNRPFKTPNDSLCIVESDTSPWLTISREDKSNQLELRLDPDVCSVRQEDLKTILNIDEPNTVSTSGGSEHVLHRESNHCFASFFLEPHGLQSLSNIQFRWY